MKRNSALDRQRSWNDSNSTVLVGELMLFLIVVVLVAAGLILLVR